ncbi:MAG: phosphoenolpyruvate synthase [Sandaracinaceae bacterium]|nr:phosphoenolpyruvate synthase [Sandaracinaceae bacterium]
MTARNVSSILWFEEVGIDDIGLVGGKNASLGEMIQVLGKEGIRVPGGFAVTATAYRDFLAHNDLWPTLAGLLASLDTGARLDEVGTAIRSLMEASQLPPPLTAAITAAYQQLGTRTERATPSVAVRSSATAEDLPDASFAGQQETFLNIEGDAALLAAVKSCFASLFTDRAITYRRLHGFAHEQVALSVAVQLMVRSDQGAAGVAFTLDTETGFPNIVLINGAWGLGEYVVKGVVNPDEWRVFKPLLANPALRPILDRRVGSKERKLVYDATGTVDRTTTDSERARLVLNDDQVLELARWCARIEAHYQKPMDIEWGLDGITGELWILQARPETVHGHSGGHTPATYTLTERGDVLVTGVAVGSQIATGKVFVMGSMAEADRFEDGGILVARNTDPDWMPLMKRAAGIVTDYGGRTSHAAIVSRELGITAIVGSEHATAALVDGSTVTVSCAEGNVGSVYAGALAFTKTALDLTGLAEPPTRIMLNVADPDAALRYWRLPVKGIGLARLEFVIEHRVKIHPMALIRFDELEDQDAVAQITALTAGYTDKTQYFVDKLAEGVAKIAASQYPHPVVVRTSDFKTNEYAELIGGRMFEPHEDNPMIGFRGASRYYSGMYREGFGLECEALRRVRDELGFDNVILMIPFCRTLGEADKVIAVMASHGLVRGENDLKLYVMAEIPSNVILAKEFAERFDGFSIGSNDLTQLILGVDRDNGLLAEIFDERNDAVKRAITDLVRVAHESGRSVGICGQAPSDHPDFAEFLVGLGIDSISLNPDSVVGVIRRITA